MDRRGRQEDVDSRLLGVAKGLPGAVDVAVVAAGEPTNRSAGRPRRRSRGRPRNRPARRSGSRPRSRPRPGSRAPGRLPPSRGAFMLAPGDCSPSRKVVSKIKIRSASATSSAMGVRSLESSRFGKRKKPRDLPDRRVSGLRCSIALGAFGRRALRPCPADKAEGLMKSKGNRQVTHPGRSARQGPQLFKDDKHAGRSGSIRLGASRPGPPSQSGFPCLYSDVW